MISFLITSKNEEYLDQTIESLLLNSFHDNEIVSEEDDGRGQRAMINKLASLAKHNIICKVDAHCSFGPDFDKYLLEDLKEKTVIAPILYPLDGETWTVNHHNPMKAFHVDENFVMQHGEGDTPCMQGSFFMCYKKFFFEANLCDESLGSWGGQAVELGMQTKLNGGECVISDKTYYGHVFRHKDEDFPYERDQKKIDETQAKLVAKYSVV